MTNPREKVKILLEQVEKTKKKFQKARDEKEDLAVEIEGLDKEMRQVVISNIKLYLLERFGIDADLEKWETVGYIHTGIQYLTLGITNILMYKGK